VVWDAYLISSIKESTREKRGRERWQIPSNWPDFLRDSINKQKLFTFLSSKIELTYCLEGKQIFATSGTAVIAKRYHPLHGVLEADTRILNSPAR
jgi:hypothetical protein